VVYNKTVNVTGTQTNECGQPLTESLLSVQTGKIAHKDDSLSLSLNLNISAFSYYGIRDVVVRLTNCGSGCSLCDKTNASVCQECEANLILANGACSRCPPGYYDSISGCSPCNIMCGECTGPTVHNCTSCDAPLVLNGSECRQVGNSYLYGLYLNDMDDDMDPTQAWDIYPNLQNHGNDECGGYRILGNSELRYRQLILSR